MKGRRLRSLTAFYILVIGAMLLGIMLGDRTVTVLAQVQPIRRMHTIVLDAGHGGTDGGAVSCTGRQESELNLEIALRLRELCRLLGLKVQMIRTADVSVAVKGETVAQRKVSDLQERVRMASAAGTGAILVSIHQNYFTDGRYYGPQVFYGRTVESEQLAKQLQACLVSALNPGSHRQAKQGEGIYLLEKAACPAVLIECGFLSNPKENALLETAAYQKKLSAVIAALSV